MPRGLLRFLRRTGLEFRVSGVNPNGNTLVSVSDEGEAFEVAPDGEVAWRFWNPQINDDGHREIIARTVRYDPSSYKGR